MITTILENSLAFFSLQFFFYSYEAKHTECSQDFQSQVYMSYEMWLGPVNIVMDSHSFD